MVFEITEFNDVIRFNIRRSENQMAANMAEIYISSSESYRPVISVNFMVFEVGEFNDIIRFNIGRSKKWDSGQYGENLVVKWLYLEFCLIYLKHSLVNRSNTTFCLKLVATNRIETSYCLKIVITNRWWTSCYVYHVMIIDVYFYITWCLSTMSDDNV